MRPSLFLSLALQRELRTVASNAEENPPIACQSPLQQIPKAVVQQKVI